MRGGYCKKNDYTKRGVFQPKEWIKRIQGVDVVFDPDLNSNAWKVGGITVGWKELPENSQSLEVEGGVKILVPRKELLLLYKCVALVERTIQRRKPGQNTVRLDSKIWKDANDILALHDIGIDVQALKELEEKTGFAPILVEAKKIISENYPSYEFKQYAFAKQFLEGQ